MIAGACRSMLAVWQRRVSYAPSAVTVPIAVADKLDPGAVNEQVQRGIGAPIGDLDGQCLLLPAQRRVIRHSPVQFGQPPQAGHHTVVCLSGSLTRTLMVRQNWIAGSENTAGRPGPPSGGASQVVSLSIQISKNPRLRSKQCSWTRSSCGNGPGDGLLMRPA